MDLRDSKAALRQRMRGALKNLPPDKRRSDSEKLRLRLKTQPVFQTAAAVLFFAPLPAEVDLWPLLGETLAAGKIIALPRFDTARRRYTAARVQCLPGELVSGRFGIREPSADCADLPAGQLDLALVPGVAFDVNGRRLGRGRGFYDRLLADFAGKKIGVAFDEQILSEIPVEPSDVKMDWIVTPNRLVSCNR